MRYYPTSGNPSTDIPKMKSELEEIKSKKLKVDLKKINDNNIKAIAKCLNSEEEG